ncbi:pyrimidine dimer DNA glycosylase/endonuclease V [uncultured Pseudodesulfovibrio sp.]|uniref:pyrimidine dimer DNA glycosylase/endonuclease V n=1 Tax=uncultured Pseudodesulfovibrio sp. TaxID=2035858 RepID=UPI0029C6C34C|nr:pyrimidine dimer DNA glycosylase/endonuclease V [uncultured Pseudodesulfovibrio sp.]
MRLWTVHPGYLDAKGLVALWREGLLARAVLHGKTKGYRNHPQLLRFREHPDPLAAIDAYLAEVLRESRRRGYHFDASKIDENAQAAKIEETDGQLGYEWQHLLRKLAERAPELFREFEKSVPEPHPLFLLVAGGVRDWEKIS